jgi:hypothetical protein
MKHLLAEYIRVGKCDDVECKSLHIQLHDVDNEVMAIAVMDPEYAIQFVEECKKVMESIVKGMN